MARPSLLWGDCDRHGSLERHDGSTWWRAGVISDSSAQPRLRHNPIASNQGYFTTQAAANKAARHMFLWYSKVGCVLAFSPGLPDPFSDLPIQATALTVQCDTIRPWLRSITAAVFDSAVPRDSFNTQRRRLSDRQSISLSCRSTRQSICKSAILWVAGHEEKSQRLRQPEMPFIDAGVSTRNLGRVDCSCDLNAVQ